MSKDYRILLALNNRSLTRGLVTRLGKVYSVSSVHTISDYSKHIHQSKYSLVILDAHFAGLSAEDVYQGTMLMHPQAAFVIYLKDINEELVKRIWKRRAFDYLIHTPNVYSLSEEVHKYVRWVAEKNQIDRLMRKVSGLKEMMILLNKELEKQKPRGKKHAS